MNKLTAGILAACGLLTVTTGALAYVGHHKPGAFSLTLGAGELFLASKRNMDNAAVPFVALAYDFTEKWAFEALLGGYTTEYKSNPPNNHNHKEINGTMFLLDGVYRFGSFYKTALEPYIVFGVGVLGMSPNGNDANNEGNINAGVGAEVFVDEVVAFRFEARDLYTWVGGKNDFMLDAGVTFLFNLC